MDGNAGFCGDRTPYINESGTGGGGTGTDTTYYGAYLRLITNKIPTFECSDEDLYTISGSSQGNKSLTNPIGLINADEVAYAGGVWSTNNTTYYLNTGQNYWTISPSYFNGTTSRADMFLVDTSGKINRGWFVNSTLGVRPVINLKTDIQFSSGDGTSETPFVIS